MMKMDDMPTPTLALYAAAMASLANALGCLESTKLYLRTGEVSTGDPSQTLRQEISATKELIKHAVQVKKLFEKRSN